MPKPTLKLTRELREQLELLPVTGCIPCLVRGAAAVVAKLERRRLGGIDVASGQRPSQLQREMMLTSHGAVIRLAWDIPSGENQTVRFLAYFDVGDELHRQLLGLLTQQEVVKLYLVENEQLKPAITLGWPWSAEAQADIADKVARADKHNAKLAALNWEAALRDATDILPAHDEYGGVATPIWPGGAVGYGRRGDSWLEVYPNEPTEYTDLDWLLGELASVLVSEPMSWGRPDEVMTPGTDYPLHWEGVAGQTERITLALLHPPRVTALEALQLIEDYMADTREMQPPLETCLAVLAAERAVRHSVELELLSIGMSVLFAGASRLLGDDIDIAVLPRPSMLPRPLQRMEIEQAARQVIAVLRGLPTDWRQQTVYDSEHTSPLRVILAAHSYPTLLRYSDIARIVLEMARQLAAEQSLEALRSTAINEHDVLQCFAQAAALLHGEP